MSFNIRDRYICIWLCHSNSKYFSIRFASVSNAAVSIKIQTTEEVLSLLTKHNHNKKIFIKDKMQR